MAKVIAISWLLSPSSATKITAVLRRKAYTRGSSQACRTRVVDGPRPGTSVDGVLVESLVRHTVVACRAGPEGQCVDSTVGDYSLSLRGAYPIRATRLTPP